MLYTSWALLGFLFAVGNAASKSTIDECPGYVASHVSKSSTGLTAKLKLAGKACNAYGKDLDDLVLQVEYQTDNRLHVKIYDAAEEVYQIPASVLELPQGSAYGYAKSKLDFFYTSKPFSFAVQRNDNKETIFNTSGSDLIFESQYLRLRTSLPPDPNIYGFGEDTDAFRRNTTNYTRTLWSRDAYSVPSGQNLYGNHPVYFEHRNGETHGVFLGNSNGIDLKLNTTDASGQYLEYNTLGGVIDLYFLAGPGPLDVARQYTDIVGKPAMMAYWHFGFHQCRYGYMDFIQLAEVTLNYSLAGIPLETLWTDIDYMDERKVFTLDPERFPLEKMQEMVSYLHNHDQHYIVMVDPAVAHQDYAAYNNGDKMGVFLKRADGSNYEGVVWPGVTVYPDWFNPDAETYWTSEFAEFFNAETGVNIDALWIDMNEASNFCAYPCLNPSQYAIDNGFPPSAPPLRKTWEPLPGFPKDFQPPASKRATGTMKGLPGRNLTDPLYKIANANGCLSCNTLDTDLVHSNGLVEYDTHNLYGTMMSSISRQALLARRPSVRPLVITRSTFAGAGSHVGHWLGDNISSWDKYRISISQILAFAGIYQIPMVGADVCGFGGNTTSSLCARWAMLGAFYPFYRNHAESGTIDQEFYRWPIVASAARTAIKARYQLLDYIYTSLHTQTLDGTPLLNAMWFLYPNEPAALHVDKQFFYGSSVLVSPVTEENSTSVEIYLPNEQFYDFFTYKPVRGKAATITLSDVAFDQIPVHIRGGSILPLRVDWANTTTALRKLDFNLVIAPGLDGTANGELYLDDGESIVQNGVSNIKFDYRNGKLTVDGSFEYKTGCKIKKVIILGAGKKGGKWKNVGNGASEIIVDKGLGGGWKMQI